MNSEGAGKRSRLSVSMRVRGTNSESVGFESLDPVFLRIPGRA